MIVNGNDDEVASSSATVGVLSNDKYRRKNYSLGTQKPTALMINMLTTLEKTGWRSRSPILLA